MIRALLLILDKYGLGVANLILLGFVSWKLFSNHLKHITEGIERNTKKLNDIDDKVDDLGERISKVEGKIE